jgi:hypothetical protein
LLQKGSAGGEGDLASGKHTLGRDPGANLNVGFLHTDVALDRLPPSAAELGGQQPLSIRIRQSLYGNDADSCVVVAAVTRAEADAPTRLF